MLVLLFPYLLIQSVSSCADPDCQTCVDDLCPGSEYHWYLEYVCSWGCSNGCVSGPEACCIPNSYMVYCAGTDHDAVHLIDDDGVDFDDKGRNDVNEGVNDKYYHHNLFYAVLLLSLLIMNIVWMIYNCWNILIINKTKFQENKEVTVFV